MAAPSTLLSIPDGAANQPFLTALTIEAQHRAFWLVIAIAFVALIGIARSFLPASARPRLRSAFTLFIIYIVCFLARAEILSTTISDELYKWFALAGALSLTFALISVVALLAFDLLARRFGVPRIMRDITTAAAMLVAIVFVAAKCGVNLLHLVTTSAVITAVVGLALQDTLGNLFSGVALQLDSSLSIGDWIKVDDRQVGQVREIRWRSTVVETRNGDLLVIPNAIINRGVITTYQHRHLEHRQWVTFSVHLRHPPNRVIQIVQDALVGTPNVSTKTPPDCIFLAFEDSAAKYAVRYRLVDVRPDDSTDSEVRKRLWYALHRANLEIPYPAQNVFLTQLTAERERGKVDRDVRRRLKAIARIPFFTPLSDDERRQLAEALHFEPFADGEVILRRGDAGDSLFIVREGRVSIRLQQDGADREVAQLGEGDFFGEMSLMTGEPRSATVVAVGDVECYVVDRALFHDVIKQNSSLLDRISALLSERQVALAAEHAGLAAGRIKPSEDQGALLRRIRNFFGFN